MSQRIMVDPTAARLPDAESPRANLGDICVAVDALGAFWIGRVTEIDAGGGVNVISTGQQTIRVAGMARAVEPGDRFLPTAAVAFGWCSGYAAAASRLTPHFKPAADAAAYSEKVPA